MTAAATAIRVVVDASRSALEPPDAGGAGPANVDRRGDDVGGGVGERESLHAEASDEREREHDVDAVLEHVQEERRPRVLHRVEAAQQEQIEREAEQADREVGEDVAPSAAKLAAEQARRSADGPRTIIPTADGSTTSVISRMPYDSRSRNRTMSPLLAADASSGVIVVINDTANSP